MTDTSHKLSIIMVSLNERRHLERLKRSIDALRLPAGVTVETLLIDGGSDDGTVALARSLSFTTVVELPGASIPACRNRGLEEAEGDWIAFVDADCELDAAWIEEAARFLESDKGTVVGWPVSPPDAGTWVQSSWHAHWLHKNRSAGTDVVRDQAFRLITTRNMLLNRAALDVVKGFDANLPTGEDTDFVFRAYVAGVDVAGVPSLRVTHHGEPATLREFFRQQLWHANRRSYRKIAEATGGRVGGNAPLYTLAFLAGAIGLLAGVVGALLTREAAWMLLGVPLVVVVGGPAALIAGRARSPALLLSLLPLYAAYGLARSMDLIGMVRAKKSWKR